MESILPYIVFDEFRNIVEVPDWATMVAAIANLPAAHCPLASEPPADNLATEAWKNTVLGLDGGQDGKEEMYNYDDLRNLCNYCEAFCCKTLVFPADIPGSIANLDYFKFCLGFPGIELGIANGAWSLVVKTTCRYLKDERCSIYDNPERPLLCQNYDPWRCNYRINFGEPRPPGFLRVNLEQFDLLAECFQFDRNGTILNMISIEDIRNYIEERWRSTTVQPALEAVQASSVSQ